MFCQKCGKEINDEAVVCVHCGCAIANTRKIHEKKMGSKDKTKAILFAVFLGAWTWIYTYKNDGMKFLIFLGVNVYLLNMTKLPLGYNYGYYENNPFFSFLQILVNLGFYIWAIVDTVKKEEEYFINYK
jgi:hypothetical protein